MNCEKSLGSVARCDDLVDKVFHVPAYRFMFDSTRTR
jgi:hypothetical protein